MNPETGNSTAASESSPEINITALTDAQTREWRMTGKLPEPKQPAAADSATAQEPPKEDSTTSQDSSADGEEATETAAETETAKQLEERRQKDRRKQTADERIQEFLVERKRKDAEIEDLRKKLASSTTAAPATSPTAPKLTESKAKAFELSTPQPKETDVDEKGQPKYKKWEEFQDARDAWRDERTALLLEERLEAKAKQAEAEKAQKAISERWSKAQLAAETKYSDFKEVAFGPNGSQRIPGDSVIGGFLADSEIGPEILYHLAQNPGDTAHIQSLNPYSQTRALVKIEDNLLGVSQITPPAKKITQAPPPPKEIGGTGTTSADEAEQALKNDDFETYRNAQNRRDLARRKG